MAAGFGISRPEHVEALRGHADAAVVGSALVQVIEQHRSADRLAERARELKPRESKPNELKKGRVGEKLVPVPPKQ